MSQFFKTKRTEITNCSVKVSVSIRAVISHIFTIMLISFLLNSSASAQETEKLLPNRQEALLTPQFNKDSDIQAPVVATDRVKREFFRAGTIVTSGFSDTIIRKPQFPEKLTKEQLRVLIGSHHYTFIDLNGYSTTLLSVDRLNYTYNGYEVQNRPYDQLLARDVGQVFGLAIDNEKFPNLYLSATSLFEFQIVGPNANEDHVPDRLLVGREAAFWMNGQWGPFEASGPGSIYKVDGETGQIEVFENVLLNGRENSGAGLENIAFDGRHRQLFVSDIETGMIHRFNSEGDDLEQFDHGRQALPKMDRKPVLFDSQTRMNIIMNLIRLIQKPGIAL